MNNLKGSHLKVILELTNFKNNKTKQTEKLDIYAKIDLLGVSSGIQPTLLLDTMLKDLILTEEIKQKLIRAGIQLPTLSFPPKPRGKGAAALSKKTYCYGSLTTNTKQEILKN